MNLFPPEAIVEIIKQTGKTLQDIVERLKGHPVLLFGIACMMLSIISLAISLFSPPSDFFKWFPYSLLIFGLLLVLFEYSIPHVLKTIAAQKTGRMEKSDLIRLMGSPNNAFAVEAARTIKARGWAYDGSLQNAFLRKANLKNADLRHFDLTGANFEGANLENADLRGTILINAKLIGANLRGANFSAYHFADETVIGSYLTEKIAPEMFINALKETPAHERMEAFITGADLSGADLTNAKITKRLLSKVRSAWNAKLPIPM
jgi:hypothetical protein